MKNTIKILGFFVGILVFLCSCKEDELTKYDKENNIYFPNQVYEYCYTRTSLQWGEDGRIFTAPVVSSSKKPAQAQDTLEHSISSAGAITLISVRLMGAISNEERKIACRAIPKDTSSVAKEGVNFEILDAFIPANSREGGIIVELDPESMSDEDVLTIELELLPNENFQTNFSQVPRKSGSAEMVSTTHITLQYTKFFGVPPAWNSWFVHIFGAWSIKKLQILVERFNFDSSDSFLGTSGSARPAYSVLIPYGMMLRDYLEEQAASGNVIMDPDGVTPMSVGTIIKNL